MALLQALILIMCGHLLAAFLVYLNHRFVFHGKLGKLPLLRHLRRKHTLHHAHAHGKNMKKHIFAPLWARCVFLVIYGIVGIFISIPFMIGLVSFSLYYAHNRLKIHTQTSGTHSYWHHRHHHRHPNTNFSGMYPTMDKVFSTYIESRPRL